MNGIIVRYFLSLLRATSGMEVRNWITIVSRFFLPASMRRISFLSPPPIRTISWLPFRTSAQPQLNSAHPAYRCSTEHRYAGCAEFNCGCAEVRKGSQLIVLIGGGDRKDIRRIEAGRKNRDTIVIQFLTSIPEVARSSDEKYLTIIQFVDCV